MESLIKKLEELNTLIKQIKAGSTAKSNMPTIPPIKGIQPPSMKATGKAPKIGGVSANSNKDPKKVAEQLKNAQAQKIKMPVLKTDQNGQWSLEE